MADRYCQARSQSPRQVDCMALWRFPAFSSTELLHVEKDAASGLEKRDLGNRTKEWFVADAATARAHVEARIGRPADEIRGAAGRRSWEGAEPWDAWRDESRFISTEARRRLWAGAEIGADGAIGTLKVVHSPYYDGFFKFAPTYAPAKFRWLTWWQTQDPTPNDRSNRLIYDLWHRIVTEHGQGPNDLAVGWLRTSDGHPKIDWADLQRLMSAAGLKRGDPTAPKPRDARPKDPTMGRNKPIGFGEVPP